MKALKKTFAIVIALAFIIGCLPLSVSAVTIFDGPFGFELDSNTRTVTLVEYKGTDTDVVIPSAYRAYPLTKISYSAFRGNTSVEYVHIPSSVTMIYRQAFMNCTSLKELEIPSDITVIGSEICSGCTSLEKLVYDSSCAVPDYAFLDCNALSDVTLSKNCTAVGTGSFERCSSLSNIGFASDLTEIGAEAFSGCSLVDIEIPVGITALPEKVFADSDSLIKVLIPRSVTQIHKKAFYNSNNTVIYCYTDSFAHNYAVENSIPFVLLDAPTEPPTEPEPTIADRYLLGDADANGNVSIIDVTVIQRRLGEMYVASFDTRAADVSADGLSVIDATLIQRYLAGLKVFYPIGEWITT